MITKIKMLTFYLESTDKVKFDLDISIAQLNVIIDALGRLIDDMKVNKQYTSLHHDPEIEDVISLMRLLNDLPATADRGQIEVTYYYDKDNVVSLDGYGFYTTICMDQLAIMLGAIVNLDDHVPAELEYNKEVIADLLMWLKLAYDNSFDGRIILQA